MTPLFNFTAPAPGPGAVSPAGRGAGAPRDSGEQAADTGFGSLLQSRLVDREPGDRRKADTPDSETAEESTAPAMSGYAVERSVASTDRQPPLTGKQVETPPGETARLVLAELAAGSTTRSTERSDAPLGLAIAASALNDAPGRPSPAGQSGSGPSQNLTDATLTVAATVTQAADKSDPAAEAVDTLNRPAVTETPRTPAAEQPTGASMLADREIGPQAPGASGSTTVPPGLAAGVSRSEAAQGTDAPGNNQPTQAIVNPGAGKTSDPGVSPATDGSEATRQAQAVARGPVTTLPSTPGLRIGPAALNGAPVSEAAQQVEPAPASTEEAAGDRADSRLPDPGNRQSPAATGHPGGRDFPPGGKPLPAVLANTPARFAEGLLDRVDDMTRQVGNGLEEPRSSLKEFDAGMQARAVAGLESRQAMPDTTMRLQLPTLNSAPISDTAPGPQLQGSDSLTVSLLGAAQGGSDKTQSARPGGTGAMNPGNNLFLHLTPDQHEWSGQLGGRIRWMQNLNISSAELKLYPAELGTLEILIAAEDDQTRVSFVTSNPAAKDLIEASLPRLRELLGQSGLLLEQGDVTHRDTNRSGAEHRNLVGQTGSGVAAETETTEALMPYIRRAGGDHQIDHFA